MRKKFQRSEISDPLRLTERDAALLRDVAEFRFLNTEQLLSLHEGSRRNIIARLSRLYHDGYLDRPEVQKSAKLASAHMVYSLGRKGAEFLSKDAQEREGFMRHVREIKKTLPLIAHASMISQFRVCLMLALKKRPDVKLTRWMQGNDLKAELKRGGKNPEIMPDAFFTLDDGKGAVNFFLEADRGTETLGTFTRKLPVYWSWKDDQRIKDALHIQRFRVLTIAPTEKRSEGLRLAGKHGDPRGTGSPMYLFAPETSYGIERPDAILEPAWKSPRDDTPHRIIE